MVKRAQNKPLPAIVLHSMLSCLCVVMFAGNCRAEVACLIEPLGPHTGSINAILQTEHYGALIGSDDGLFQYQARDHSLKRLDSGSFGKVTALNKLSQNEILVGTEKGLFHYDFSSDIALVHPKILEPTQVDSIMPLGSDKALIFSKSSLFVYDSPTSIKSTAPSIKPTFSGKKTVMTLIDGSVLIGDGTGLYHLDQAGQLRHLSNRPVHIIEELSDGDALVGDDGGLRRYSYIEHALVDVSSTETGYILTALKLGGDRILVGARNGLYLFTGANGSSLLRQDPSTSTGEVMALVSMTTRNGTGFVLVGAGEGLFTYNEQQLTLEREPASKETSFVFDLRPISKREALIFAENGVFHYNSAADDRVTHAGGLPTGDVNVFLRVGNGDILIGASLGLFVGPAMPMEGDNLAKVVGQGSLPQQKFVGIQVRFYHPCASQIDKLDLSIVATEDGKRAREFSPYTYDSAKPDVAVISTPLRFDHPGDWHISLLQGKRRVLTEAGVVSVTDSGKMSAAAFSTLWGAGLILAGIAFQAFFLLALFIMSHKSTSAFSMLSDSAFTKYFNWPLLLIRHTRLAQRWVLAPWFRAMSVSLGPHESEFLDVQVTSTSKGKRKSSDLITDLKSGSRVWLLGGSGMGKTTVFRAWRSRFFNSSGSSTLSASVRLHSFIFISFRARDYAFLSVDASDPSRWVVGAVWDQLLRFGFREVGMIEYMLRSGHIAVAVDGLNETDRSKAVQRFAESYRDVPLLITSQEEPSEKEGWEIWRLPDNIKDLVVDLLPRLLKEDSVLLYRHIIDSGLISSIVSGYDIRLMVDLVMRHVSLVDMPKSREDLYEAILLSALEVDNDKGQIEKIEELAWTMVIANLYEMGPQDEGGLWAGALESLAGDNMRILSRRRAIFEFRHNQMRAYLAARRTIRMSSTVDKLIEQAEKTKDIHDRKQAELWSFVVAMLPTSEYLQALWRFANAEAAARISLLTELQVEAERRGDTLSLPPKRRRRVA